MTKKFYDEDEVEEQLLLKPMKFLVAKIGDADKSVSKWQTNQVRAAIDWKLSERMKTLTWWLVGAGIASAVAAICSALAAWLSLGGHTS